MQLVLSLAIQVPQPQFSAHVEQSHLPTDTRRVSLSIHQEPCSDQKCQLVAVAPGARGRYDDESFAPPPNANTPPPPSTRNPRPRQAINYFGTWADQPTPRAQRTARDRGMNTKNKALVLINLLYASPQSKPRPPPPPITTRPAPGARCFWLGLSSQPSRSSQLLVVLCADLTDLPDLPNPDPTRSPFLPSPARQQRHPRHGQ